MNQQPPNTDPEIDQSKTPPFGPRPPGAGSPIQPGPPLSVQAPIRDITINRTAVSLLVGGVILLIIVVLIIVVVLGVVHGSNNR
ncbi:MAG TPA: hypothetical protein VHW91_03255 [Candidatus Dormibacteraeota bacterium]|jgi:hypothetical protein|nr:hypothetical protein [Candidatus Dormibacteraeota bacterium]